MAIFSNRDDNWTTGVTTDFIPDVNESQSGELIIANFVRIDSRARAQKRLDRGRTLHYLLIS